MTNSFVRSGSVVVSVFLAVFAARLFAADLDLATAGDKTLTSFEGVDNVLNSGGELRTLTVNVATDTTFGGTISGNVKLVKEGDGFLKLTNAGNSYSGGNVVNDGRLIATEPTALGDTTKTITVNSDCSQDMAPASSSWSEANRNIYSNKITCVVFSKQATFAYPIHFTGWTSPSIGGAGCGRQYNIALPYKGTKLTGELTCDAGSGVALHLGSTVIGVSAAASQTVGGTGTPEVNGNVTCPEGVVSFQNFGTEIAVNGCVKAAKMLYDTGSQRPEIITLKNSGNRIDVIQQGGSAANGRPLTASAAGALGGGVIYTVSDYTSKSPLIVLGASQTITALKRNPNASSAMPSPMTYATSYPQCHNVGTDAAATLTMTSGVDVVCDWWFKDGRPDSSHARLDGDATKPLSLVWAPTADCTLTTAGWSHPIHGSITVSRGTFVIDPNGSFKNVSAVYVAEGATLTTGTDSFGTTVAFEIGATSVLNVPAGTQITMQSLKVGNKYVSVGEHSDLAQVQGGGTVFVVTNPGAVEKDVAWTAGGGVDTDMLTAANWEGNEVPNLEDGVATLHFAQDGTCATLTNIVVVKGLTFDGTDDFTLAATSGSEGLVRLGVAGISNAVNGTARKVTVSTPIMPMQDQVWRMSTNVALTVSGGLRQAPSDANITIRSSSKADPVVTIRGSASEAAAETENDFAGDVLAEYTNLGTEKRGVPNLRLSGYAPLGRTGTLTVETLRSGENNYGRDPRLYLTNAVVTKAISYTGGLYPGYIYTDVCSTNVIRGTITATSVAPAHFVLESHSRLVFDGEQRYTYSNKYTSDTFYFKIQTAVQYQTVNAEVVFNAPFTLSGNANTRLYLLNHIKKIEFNASGNVAPRLEYVFDQTSESTMSFGADFAFTNGTTKLLLPSYVGDGAGQHAITYFDLQGHDQWFGSLRGGNAWTFIRSTGKDATFHVTQSDESSTPFRGQMQAGVTFLKDGDVTLTFNRSTADEGNRQVFKAGSHLALGGGAVVFAGNATVPFEASRSGGATVSFQGGSLDLGSGKTASVYKAYYADASGVLQPLRRGTYTAGQAGLPASVQITSGTLKVLSSDITYGLTLVVW